MTDPKALEELDLASRAIERARALMAAEGSVPECSYCHGRGYVAGDPEGAPIEDCQQCGGTGRASSPSPAVRDALDHLHAMAPGIRDLDALDAIEKDDESMRSAVRVREALEKAEVALCAAEIVIDADDCVETFSLVQGTRQLVQSALSLSPPEGGKP